MSSGLRIPLLQAVMSGPVTLAETSQLAGINYVPCTW